MKALSRACVSNWGIAIAGCLIAVSAYLPSLSGLFVFDDDAHLDALRPLHANASLANLWQATWSSNSGPTGRPVAMLSFAADAAVDGLDPIATRLVNLVVHCATGFILFLLAKTLLAALSWPRLSASTASLLAALAASIWLLHPFNLTSVAYVIQRMNALSALFTAAAVLLYARERLRQQSAPGHWPRALAAIALPGMLAILSKENGALLPIYMLVVEVFTFRFKAQRKRDASITIWLFIVTVGLPTLLVLVWIGLHPARFLGPLGARDFTGAERLLTEPRALMWYLRMLLVPDIREMTLYHDAFPISHSLVSPPTTAAAIGAIVLLLAASWRLRDPAPWLGLGVCWFFAGHALESTIFPLELVFEHRNYLPGFGILFAAVVGAERLSARLRLSPSIVAGVAVMAILTLAGSTYARAWRWSGQPEAQLAALTRQPQSPRANILAGNLLSELAKHASQPPQRAALLSEAESHFGQAAALKPDSPNAYFGWLFLKYAHGLPGDQAVIEALKERLRVGQPDATTVNGLHRLTDCTVVRTCPLGRETFLGIMNAALENPKLPRSSASRVRCDMARYAAMVERDPARAVSLTQEASDLDPGDLNVRLELALYLATAHRSEEARSVLADLSARDVLGRFAPDIERVKSLLTGMDKAPLDAALRPARGVTGNR
jgi:hypothetical protein